MINKEYLKQMEMFFERNLSDINEEEIFRQELEVEQDRLKRLGYFIDFIQDTKTRTDIPAPNTWLITTCKIKTGTQTAEAFEAGYGSHSKYRALIAGLKKVIG
jgi:outer membrane protein assembly factor BamA